MCGIYGFVHNGGAIPREDHERMLCRIASMAGTRGPHTNGVASLDGGKAWQVSRRRGSARDNPAQRLSGSPMVIGHSRLATGHNPFVVEEAQPMHDGRLVLVHNGVVRRLSQVEASVTDRMATRTDSEALLIVAGDALRLGHPLEDCLSQAIVRCHIDSPYAMVLADGETGSAVFARRDLPLWELRSPHGIYLCSRAFPHARVVGDAGVEKYGITVARRRPI